MTFSILKQIGDAQKKKAVVDVRSGDTVKVTQKIKDFISKASTGNYFILTSRPEGGLMSFGDFQSFSINPLSKEEAYGLLEKYDRSDNKEISNKLYFIPSIEIIASSSKENKDIYLYSFVV